VTFGFDIEPIGKRTFEHSFIVYQREKIRDRIDYLAAFTMGAVTRVNLFTYRDYREPWTQAFVADPMPGLAEVLPGLASVIGDHQVIGPVVARPIDLYTSDRYRRDGVVLIGDAFQASCPATGMGMVRLLTDIEQLTTLHVPRWLETPGMGASKITTFYDDPVKRACDAKAMHDSEYRRAVSTETSLAWRMHRMRVQAMEGLFSWRRHDLASSNPRISRDQSHPSLVAGLSRAL
jgi:2-polyprenyl-6-methoxyphenol hydroxylase-like FAD-dependent oxidoreductase